MHHYKKTTVISFLISFFSITTFAHAARDTIFVFVAKNGRDVNNGTAGKPFATLETARDAIRQMKTNGSLNQPVVVYLRGGVYFISKSFELNQEDAISGVNPLIYEAYPGEIC